MTRVALAAVLLLAACTGPAANAGPVATASVDLPRSYLFSPKDIVVDAGTTVTWTNDDQFTHSVQLLSGPAGVGTNLVLRPGETATFAFAQPGRYEYVCSFHPRDMRGTVTVRGK